jgi:dTDP-L-rhamnose 4-epimerase
VGDIRHCFADLGAARRLLGFTPQVSLAQGLRQFTAWAAGQPVHEDRLAQATEELRNKGLAN